MLTFDPGPHRYAWNGVVVPSVTQALEAAGCYDFGNARPEDLERGRQRGTAVHTMTELYDNNDLDVDDLDEQLVGYLKAWQLFLFERKVTIEAVEQKVYNKTHRYAGTLDRLLIIGNRVHPCLLDIKTGIPQRATGPQTAAYLACLPKAEQKRRRVACYLQADGTYKVVEHDDRSDFDVFLAALHVTRGNTTIANWKETR